MAYTLQHGVEDQDDNSFYAEQCCGDIDYGSFDETWQALCSSVNYQGHCLRRVEGSMFERLARVEAVFYEEWLDDNRQQKCQIWLIRRLT